MFSPLHDAVLFFPLRNPCQRPTRLSLVHRLRHQFVQGDATTVDVKTAVHDRVLAANALKLEQAVVPSRVIWKR